jgi:hypothetical protein
MPSGKINFNNKRQLEASMKKNLEQFFLSMLDAGE